MSEYRLTDVDAELWRRVKTRAAYEGRTVRFVLIALLKIYAEHGFRVVETAAMLTERRGKKRT